MDERTGLPPAALSASIERRNRAREAGRDPEMWPVVSNTQGGPVHDERQRVIDVFGKPVRLYAAGELGSVFGRLYPSGGNLAECFVGGRIAGRAAAAETPTDDAT